MTRRTRVLAALAALVMLSGGCASIPERTSPKSITGVDADEVVAAKPTENASPYDIVREFIGHTATPEVAKLYLTEDARKAWNPDVTPSIIDTQFSAGPPASTPPDAAADGTEQVVAVRGSKVGRLGTDNSFIPAVGAYEQEVTVHRQPDGQWRISSPPATTAIKLDDFNANFLPVKIYFFDPDLHVLVPDLRYVVNQPASGLPSRVIGQLLAGPSEMMGGAVVSALNAEAHTRTNTVPGPDGVVAVDLTQLNDQTVEGKRRIAAQIVLSLRQVGPGQVRLLLNGAPLVPGQEMWTSGDFAYDTATNPSPDLPGMVVAGGRIRSLSDGAPIDGPAGRGEYQVQSAAQSVDGSLLAVVEAVPGGGVRLRVGNRNDQLSAVELPASSMTRPSWGVPVDDDEPPNEVWTVVDGTTAVRVVRTKDGNWAPTPVNTASLGPFGQISNLRLSRDGSRMAMVANGKVVVSAVVRNPDGVVVKQPRTLQQNALPTAVAVDWSDQSRLAVATMSSQAPVFSLSVDGLGLQRYSGSNLNVPITAITAAPSRPMVVTDAYAMWTTSEPGEIWQSHPHSLGANTIPFYPG